MFFALRFKPFIELYLFIAYQKCFSPHSIPIEDILTKPTIIELAAIENSDQKALIIALLLLSILAYVNSNYVGEGDLKNVILLEEAHVLLDADTNAGQGDANPSAIAQGLCKVNSTTTLLTSSNSILNHHWLAPFEALIKRLWESVPSKTH